MNASMLVSLRLRWLQPILSMGLQSFQVFWLYPSRDALRPVPARRIKGANEGEDQLGPFADASGSQGA